MLLKNLWQVNRCLDKQTKLLLVKQLIISRLDYCNVLYAGLPKKLLDSLQRVLNSCVRFVYGLYGHQESPTELGSVRVESSSFSFTDGDGDLDPLERHWYQTPHS
eukprot:sb/3477897/